MTDEELGGLVIEFALKIIVFLIALVFIRWLFRINEIADYLKRLAGRLAPDISDITDAKNAIKQGRCDYCHKHFTPDKLTITDSNTVTCPTCAKLL